MTQALKALEEREDDGVCLGCNGAGSVRAMTSHLGPDDYEYDEECAACNGSGSPHLKDTLESVGVICHPQWPSRLYMNREQVMRIADARAALAQQEAQASPTMDDALAVGDGTLHSAVDYWQKRALAAEGVRDVNETNNVLANNYIELCAKLEEAQAADFPPLESGRWTAEQKRIVTLMVERARGEAQAAEVSVCETFTAPLVGCVAVVRQAAEVVLPAAAFEPDVPDYHSEAMGCGLEDRGIRDRYDAMQYGWTEGVDRTLELIPDDLYTADQVREAVLLDRAGRGVEK